MCYLNFFFSSSWKRIILENSASVDGMRNVLCHTGPSRLGGGCLAHFVAHPNERNKRGGGASFTSSFCDVVKKCCYMTSKFFEFFSFFQNFDKVCRLVHALTKKTEKKKKKKKKITIICKKMGGRGRRRMIYAQLMFFLRLSRRQAVSVRYEN